MPGTLDETQCTPWVGTPGLYAILNVDSGTALDSPDARLIHAWNFGDSFQINNQNQQWQLADVGEKKWLLINAKSGQYVAAPEYDSVVKPQTGQAQQSSVHWRIVQPNPSSPEEIRLLSVKQAGACLEVKGGESKDGAEVRCAAVNVNRKGQICYSTVGLLQPPPAAVQEQGRPTGWLFGFKFQ